MVVKTLLSKGFWEKDHWLGFRFSFIGMHSMMILGKTYNRSRQEQQNSSSSSIILYMSWAHNIDVIQFFCTSISPEIERVDAFRRP